MIIKTLTKYPYYKFFEKNRSDSDAKEIYNQRIDDALHIFKKHKHNFKRRNCPYCGSSKNIDIEKFHNTFGISECGTCKGQFVNPVPNLDAIIDYYNNGKCNILLDNLYKKRKKNTNNFILDDRIEKALECLKKISKVKKHIKVLELGCGSGSFLSKLKNRIETIEDKPFFVDYFGIDVDSNAVTSKVDSEINLFSNSVEEYAASSNEKFDIILHFELIEHLIDPKSFMESAKKLMNAESYMIFTTPNQNGLEMIASHYNSYRLLAHSLFPPMHLNAFSTINISHFVLKCGFSIEEIETPGNFDVDMISITSEHVVNAFFKDFANIDENTKAFIQQLVRRLKASSHMQCVLKSNSN